MIRLLFWSKVELSNRFRRELGLKSNLMADFFEDYDVSEANRNEL